MTLSNGWALQLCKTAQPAGQRSCSDFRTTSTNEAAQASFVLGIEWHDRKIIKLIRLVAIGVETPFRPEG